MENGIYMINSACLFLDVVVSIIDQAVHRVIGPTTSKKRHSLIFIFILMSINLHKIFVNCRFEAISYTLSQGYETYKEQP